MAPQPAAAAAAAPPLAVGGCGAVAGPSDAATTGRTGSLATHSTKPRHTRPARPHAATGTAAAAPKSRAAVHGAGAAEQQQHDAAWPGERQQQQLKERGSLEAWS